MWTIGRQHAASVLLVLCLACSGSDTTAPPSLRSCPQATPLAIQTPPGFPELRSPADNPLTVEGVALGRRLFYDPILSGDSTQACASCHLQSASFGDPRRFSIGIDGFEGTRQAPTIVNAAWLLNAFWDGRVTSLEDQAREPVPNPIEMHLAWSDAVPRLLANPEYPDLFCAAFGDTLITQNRVVKAVAQFERTFLSWNAKADRVARGEDTFTPAETMGRNLFFTEIGDCFHCHGQTIGFDQQFHNTGLDSIHTDPGLGGITGDPTEVGKFKSPSLRNIMASAPYMHDGRFATIREVMDHYNYGFINGPNVDALISGRLTRPKMRPGQIDTLILYLQTLTDSTFLNNPALSNPFPAQP